MLLSKLLQERIKGEIRKGEWLKRGQIRKGNKKRWMGKRDQIRKGNKKRWMVKKGSNKKGK